jgi:Tfp pilus assembly protein PilF
MTWACFWVLAHDFFQQAVMRDPRYAEAHHNLALLLKEEGRGAEAQVFFAKAQELRGRKL